ncbi:Fic family protein [Treponema parvum]|uniref:Fic family protein n=1 Tax=Treponema parvum TaxID=138851 RepID=A0A975IC43_9SPIR|nr:Fic family protein [Treponema parvum]QTQ11367.1 Fic family protein [Treponema parvum]
MHNFEYEENAKRLLTPEIVQLLSSIYEHKGRQQLFVEAKKDELHTLMDIAKIQSTKSSNRIEGIYTTDKRLEELMSQKSQPRNRNEQEISGYRDVLATIHENYDYISPTSNIIQQLHRDLYSYNKNGFGGKFKSSDNIIAETDNNDIQKVRFAPVPAYETEEAVRQMTENFLKSWNSNKTDRLLLIPLFVLDFLCIHPFDDGNGRMSRLLTLLLFYRAGFIAGKYISIEMLIENSKETYYEALQDCSSGWHENTNSYEAFVRYYFGILIKAYNEFENRVEYLSSAKISKPERVKNLIQNTVGKINKREILEKCPDISKKTVERALADLVKQDLIEKVGASSATAYVWIQK